MYDILILKKSQRITRLSLNVYRFSQIGYRIYADKEGLDRKAKPLSIVS